MAGQSSKISDLKEAANAKRRELRHKRLEALPYEKKETQRRNNAERDYTRRQQRKKNIVQYDNEKKMHAASERNRVLTMLPEKKELFNAIRANDKRNKLNAMLPEKKELFNAIRAKDERNRVMAMPPERKQLFDVVRAKDERNWVMAMPPERKQLFDVVRAKDERNRVSAMPPERKQLFDVVRAKDERNRLNAMSMEKWTQLRTMRTEQNKIWRSKMGVKDKYTKQVQDAMNKRARRFFFECEEAEKLRLKYQAVVEEKQWECVYNKIIAQFPKCVCISRCTTVDITIDSMDVDQANNEDDMSVSYNNFSFAEYFHHDNEMDGDGLLSLNSSVQEDFGSLDDLDGEGGECSNCRRKQFSTLDEYKMVFHPVLSTHVRSTRHAFKKILHSEGMDDEAEIYTLCQECYNFLSTDEEIGKSKYEIKKMADWNNTWPSFFWDLLSGRQAGRPDHMYSVYGPLELWKYIPTTMRPYWEDAIKTINDDRYGGCTLENPPSYFRDCTLRIKSFREDINSYDLSRMIDALSKEKPSPNMIPDVLCPWGCTEFCYEARECNLSVLIQHHLRKVVLNLPQSTCYTDIHKVETSRQDYIRHDGRYECVNLNKEWPIMPSVKVIPKKGLFALVCRYHMNTNETKRLYPHPPRRPFHNLSAVGSDQLSPCVMQPRMSRISRRGKYNSVFGMNIQQASYVGVDSMNVTTEGRFTNHNVLAMEHEALSVAGRDDINALLSRKTEEGEILPSLATNIREISRRRYVEGSLTEYIQGATYVPLVDSMRLQMDAAEENVIDVIVSRRQPLVHTVVEVHEGFKRSWNPAINYIQMEDKWHYGYPFKAIGKYNGRKKQPSMMLWGLCGIISGCKELYQVIDQKQDGFRFDGWEGHMLTHIQHCYIHHTNMSYPKSSPFVPKNSKTNRSMLTHIARFMPEEMVTYPGMHQDNYELFFYCGIEYWRRLFPMATYPSIAIESSVPDVMCYSPAQINDKDILFIVEGADVDCDNESQHLGRKEFPNIEIHGEKFEARVILTTTDGVQNVTTSNSFIGVRYVRHGAGFSSWWKQQRTRNAPVLMSQCIMPNVSDDISAENKFYFTVYVKLHQKKAQDYKMDFHRLLGGQMFVFCSCNDSPLIVTGRHPEEKRLCMVGGCLKKELYICSCNTCQTRICKSHFQHDSQGNVKKTYHPPVLNDNIAMDMPPLDEGTHDDDDESIVDDEHMPVSFRDSVRMHQNDNGDDLFDEDMDHMDQYQDEFFTGDFLTNSNFNPLDINGTDVNGLQPTIPATNSGDFPYTHLHKRTTRAVPCHVLFNQAGVLCTRFNKRISGTNMQKNFLQRIVSTVAGTCMPLLYMMASCFPRHFYACASHDRTAVLGSPPLVCLSSKEHMYGFASNLSVARCFITHASSSTSTCPIMLSFLYDIQANAAAGKIDSRTLNKHGFQVDLMSSQGISTRDNKEADLNESVDSHQAALDLSATQGLVDFDWFTTLSCNQALSPGTSVLHKHKEGKKWIQQIPYYDKMDKREQMQVHASFEQAYGSVLARSWLETRKLWLEYITYSLSSVLGPVAHVFFRDEFQECTGNLSHIHGLIAIRKEHIHNNEDVKKFILDLQSCNVCDLIPYDTVPQYFLDKLLVDLKNQDVRAPHEKLGREVLGHICNDRCLMMTADGLKCKKPHSVRDSIHPTEHDFVRINYEYNDRCLAVLRSCGLYHDPVEGEKYGKFDRNMFVPRRHMGAVNPNAECNMSPVIPQFFVAFQSMQNWQVLTNTNGAARYVVKYVTKIDEGNRCIIHADPHSGAILRIENEFLHNTKITRSKIYEDKAFASSRRSNHPTGRAIAPTEMVQQLLGYPEVMTTLDFIRLDTKPFELRKSTKLVMDDAGNILRYGASANALQDVQATLPFTEFIRQEKHFPDDRRMSPNQKLLYRHNGSGSTRYDNITLFGLRPIEMKQLFPRLKYYFRWFFINLTGLSATDVQEHTTLEIGSCYWIDCFGHHVLMRRKAFKEIAAYLNAFVCDGLCLYTLEMKNLILSLILEDSDDCAYIYDNDRRDLPIIVYASISPHHATSFITHMLLMLGEYETELDFHLEPTIRDQFVKVKLIGNEVDVASLRQYRNQLSLKLIDEMLTVQPLSLYRLQDYIVTADILFKSILEDNALPIMGLPSCLLSMYYTSEEKKMTDFWNEVKENHLTSIYRGLSEGLNIPTHAEVSATTRSTPIVWDPVETFVQSPNQSVESYTEQKFALKIATDSVSKYQLQFGPGATTYTKSPIIHGAPGSGKSYIAELTCLYIMSQGLKLMSTALMAVRAMAIGGIHLHKFLGLHHKSNGTPHHAAALALLKLRLKCNVCYLHAILTMDALFIDETGQLSAEQLMIIDIIFRSVRKSNTSFGGVWLIGTLDHTQFGTIEGMPFLLSSHIVTMFVLIQLKHSVRAQNDPDFQRIQAITRIDPNTLRTDEALKLEFYDLVERNITFVPDWNDPKITSNVQRMYARKVPAQTALRTYVDACIMQFDRDRTMYIKCNAVDLQKTVGSRAEFVSASPRFVTFINHSVKEPELLLFWEGALFEATANGVNYSQSQLLMMVERPSLETLHTWSPLSMLAAPSGLNYIDLSDGVPATEMLIEQGWKKVKLRCTGESNEHLVQTRGVIGGRKQYTIKHVGAGTINKQMGNTIHGKCAIEMSPVCIPWEKAQIVVMLSRTKTAQDTIIVGDMTYAINKMWELIITGNQWTPYIEEILNRLSVSVNNTTAVPQVVRYAETVPFRACEISLPTDTTGYVYMLLSVRDMDRTYVGRTNNLARRFHEHNSGSGSAGTEDATYRPYCMAAYICGLSHMIENELDYLERRWKLYIHNLPSGNQNVWARIQQGCRIVEEYNANADEINFIRFVITIEQRTL